MLIFGYGVKTIPAGCRFAAPAGKNRCSADRLRGVDSIDVALNREPVVGDATALLSDEWLVRGQASLTLLSQLKAITTVWPGCVCV